MNLKDTLADVTVKEATTKVYSLNTIAALVYHINYYVRAILEVMRGGPLNAKDSYSFDLPVLNTEEDWLALKEGVPADAEQLALLIEKIPEHQLWEAFTDEKYGHYYRNLHGVTEHSHYHLGQIAIVKKILQQQP